MAFTASFSFYVLLNPTNSKRIWTYVRKEALATAHDIVNVYKYVN
jgi:hypothetical protein